MRADGHCSLHRVFATLLAARFPIRRMHLVDRYRGRDYASIQADNTSSFNCRDATGSSRWSEHAYGLAIDVNPIENPYVYANGTSTHPASAPFLNRADVRPGMAVAGGGSGAGLRRRRVGLGRTLATADRFSAFLHQRALTGLVPGGGGPIGSRHG